MKRAVLAILLVLVLLASVGGAALLASGILSDDEPESEPRTVRVPERSPVVSDPTVTEPPRPALAEFYAQQVEWSACRGDFECAVMEAPLDYRDPRGERIEIALLRVPARSPEHRIGSLVVNPGGPGAPGTTYAENARYAFGDALRDSFDIVGFDPRGTGSSTTVDCLTDSELDDYLAGDPDPDTPAEEREAIEWVDRFGEGCVERSGPLVGHVSTIEAARDMDILRAVLGEPGMTYFGASYGTRLGATYADLFPDRATWMVLDGAVDLELPSREQSLQQAAGFETALRAYVENCLESSGCFLGGSVEEGLQTISDLLDSIDEEPLPTSTSRELQVGNAFYGIVAPLYNRDYWTYLSTALRTARNGDGSLLLMLADLYASRGDDGYDDNSAEAIYAINCLDDPWAIEPDQVADEVPAFEEASPTFGRVFAWGLIGCGGIQVTTAEKPREITATGAPPILVIGTTRDPATPVQWAEAMAEQLDSGVLVRRDGDGHTGYNQGNPCVDEVVEGYLLDGTVPDGDVDCPAP
ncbi:alpha/beta hydrolase [Nocardioides sp.]|uniref:alpha/beta hydrolase n=1 Tax=Nocardioides sp. TaxID=35761 RepID=UPI002735EA8D|nr:alpha/beta hydrolase [Nocardioides sp.]MDP3894364.1 alpha/beta hydrolase [Nocardioides sp.]